MSPQCKFLSEDPVITDNLTSPALRFLCRNPSRTAKKDSSLSEVTARYVGNSPYDCDICPYYESSDWS